MKSFAPYILYCLQGPTPTVTSDFLTASSKEKDLTSSFERSNNVYELSQMTESEKLAARMFVKLSSQYLTQDKVWFL